MKLTEWKVGPRQADNAKFGELFETMRHNARLTRHQVSTQLNLSEEYIRLIELGRRVPAENSFHRFLNLYSVSYRIDGFRWVIGAVSIEFTSRIKAAHGEAAVKVTPFHITPMNKAKGMAQIVQNLTKADTKTLAELYNLLDEGSRENHSV